MANKGLSVYASSTACKQDIDVIPLRQSDGPSLHSKYGTVICQFLLTGGRSWLTILEMAVDESRGPIFLIHLGAINVGFLEFCKRHWYEPRLLAWKSYKWSLFQWLCCYALISIIIATTIMVIIIITMTTKWWCCYWWLQHQRRLWSLSPSNHYYSYLHHHHRYPRKWRQQIKQMRWRQRCVQSLWTITQSCAISQMKLFTLFISRSLPRKCVTHLYFYQ